jgi:hypothetical protein
MSEPAERGSLTVAIAGSETLPMGEPEFFYDRAAQTILIGDDPRVCLRCDRGPEPTAIIDNSGNQFAAISLCVHCVSELAEALAKAFPRAD